MSDVTAVILTIGEATTQRAIESVKGQSLQPCEIIVIDHISPFHRAMAHAVKQVRSTFFVQVDADMILDPQCFAELRKCMEPQVGVVVGSLRDPLLQRVTGVKMYRTSCLQHLPFQDSISPDTDMKKALLADGWCSIRALGFSPSETGS
ncbi:MAG: glycosyltransferase family A protein [Nitrospirae bacterium]|nr:glycosyltransferase family A protein [Nitrospirota bacterium]